MQNGYYITATYEIDSTLCCPARADFVSVLIRAAYDQNVFDSAAATCIIGISIENWTRYCVVYLTLEHAGPIIPWLP